MPKIFPNLHEMHVAPFFFSYVFDARFYDNHRI